LPLEEQVKFETAISASNNSRRDDWNEETRLRYGILDSVFPQAAGRNRLFVLKQTQGLRRAAEQTAQVTLDALAQWRQRTTGVPIVVARIREEADEFRKLYQRRQLEMRPLIGRA
jgi:hypothetical protein